MAVHAGDANHKQHKSYCTPHYILPCVNLLCYSIIMRIVNLSSCINFINKLSLPAIDRLQYDLIRSVYNTQCRYSYVVPVRIDALSILNVYFDVSVLCFITILKQIFAQNLIKIYLMMICRLTCILGL